MRAISPVLHIDVYGTMGIAFGTTIWQKIADYMTELVR